MTNGAHDGLENENVHFLFRQLFGTEISRSMPHGLALSMSTPLGMGLEMSMSMSVPHSRDKNGVGNVNQPTSGDDENAVDPKSTSSVRTPYSATSSVGASAGVIATASLLAAAALVIIALVAYRRRSHITMVSGASSVGTDFTSVA
jgi:hypothetical protein